MIMLHMYDVSDVRAVPRLANMKTENLCSAEQTQRHGTRLFVSTFDRRFARDPPFRAAQHLCWIWRSRVVVGWRAAIDARARSTALREDIFPGHTQYFAVGRTGGFDVHEAGRDAGNCFVAFERRMGVALRPER